MNLNVKLRARFKSNEVARLSGNDKNEFNVFAWSVSRHLRVTAVRDAFPSPATPLNLGIFGHGPQDVTTLTGHTMREAAVRITCSGLKNHVNHLVMHCTSRAGM